MSGLRAVQILGPSSGGIRVHVATLAAGLAEVGIAAPVVGPAGVLEGLGPQAGVVPVPDGMSPMGLLRARAALRPWRHEASVVHAHGLKAGWVALGGRPRRPVVLTLHNVVLDESAGRSASLQRRLERAVITRADRVIAPSPAVAEGLRGVVPDDRIRMIVPASPVAAARRAGTEVRAELGFSDDTPLVVCVSRLHPQKDLTTLLRAWSEVSASRPDARLVVVGEGPQRDDLAAQVLTRGLEGSVQLLGFRTDAVDVLAAADVAVLTSVWEGVPLVLIETLQLGVPLVSTDVGLAAELLGPAGADGEPIGGVVVPVGDPHAVAAALLPLLADRERSRRVGRTGRARVEERFDLRTLCDEVAAVYREVA